MNEPPAPSGIDRAERGPDLGSGRSSDRSGPDSGAGDEGSPTTP
jgi:hypothetical protein